MDQLFKYKCPKCGNSQYEIDEIWSVGSFWTRIFEIHNRRFTYVACKKCQYTELFKVPKKDIGETYNFLAR